MPTRVHFPKAAAVRGRTLAFLWLGISGLGAAETDRPSTAPGDDAIAAAKRDFEQIRALPPESASKKTDLSFFSVPVVGGNSDLSVVPAAAPALGQPGDGGLPRLESSHWLLDAYASQLRPGRASESMGPSRWKTGEASPDLPDRKGVPGESSKPGGGVDREADPAGRGSDHAFSRDRVDNPLDRYMANWISPRDQTLLLTPLASDPDSSFFRGDPKLTAATKDVAAVAGWGADGGALVDTPWPNALPRLGNPDRENPYLALLNLPAERSTTSGPSLGPPPGSLDAATPELLFSRPAATEPPPGNRSFLSDLGQPSDDDKYFKQLKRF